MLYRVTDTDGQLLPQEIWLEEEYGTFSPAMYSFVDDKRWPASAPGGFWDKHPAGVYPPATQTLGLLDSGYEASDVWSTGTAASMAHPPCLVMSVPPHPTTSISSQTQATEAGATTVDDVPFPNPFGYLMYWGVLANGDVGILPWGIYEDDDGDPATEGGLIAWWDGVQYRWGIDGSVVDGVVTPEDAFAPVDPALLAEWALSPLQEEPDFDLYPDTGFPPGPLYETGVMDDLAGLNIDYFVYLGRNYNAVANPTFTIRMTAVSVDAAGVEPDDYGNETPAWVDNPAPPLETFLDACSRR